MFCGVRMLHEEEGYLCLVVTIKVYECVCVCGVRAYAWEGV